MLARTRLLALTLAASAAACGTVISPADVGTGNDAGNGSDAVDTVDAGSPPDDTMPRDAQFPDVVLPSDVARPTDAPMGADTFAIDAPAARDVQFSDVQTDAPPQYPQRGGVIQIATQTFGGFGSNSNATAAFYDDLSQVVPGNCTQRTSGNCTVLKCTSGGTTDAGTPAFLSAGTISIQSAGTADVTLTPGTNNQYMGFNDMSAYWNPGNAVSISASGSTVPAFSASLVFPGVLDVTDPVVTNPFTDRVTIDRATGLVVRWSPTDGEVTVTILQQNSSTNALGAQLACTFPGADGSAAIPPSALADLSPSPPNSTTPDTFLIAGENAASVVTAGTYTVNVTAQNMAFFAGAQVR